MLGLACIAHACELKYIVQHCLYVLVYIVFKQACMLQYCNTAICQLCIDDLAAAESGLLSIIFCPQHHMLQSDVCMSKAL